MEYTMGRVAKYVSDGEKMSIVYVDDFSAYGEYKERFENILNAVKALPEDTSKLMREGINLEGLHWTMSHYQEEFKKASEINNEMMMRLAESNIKDNENRIDLINKFFSIYQPLIDEVLARDDIKAMIAEDRVHAVGLEIAHKVAAKIFGEDMLITKEELNDPEFIKVWELFYKEYGGEATVFSFPLNSEVIRSFVKIMAGNDAIKGILHDDYEEWSDDMIFTYMYYTDDGAENTIIGLSLVKEVEPRIDMTKEQFDEYINILIDTGRDFDPEFREICKNRDAKKYVEYFKDHGSIDYDARDEEVEFESEIIYYDKTEAMEAFYQKEFGVSADDAPYFSRKVHCDKMDALKEANSPIYDFIDAMKDEAFEEEIQAEGRAYLRIDEEGNPYPQEAAPQEATEPVDEFTLNATESNTAE